MSRLLINWRLPPELCCLRSVAATASLFLSKLPVLPRIINDRDHFSFRVDSLLTNEIYEPLWFFSFILLSKAKRAINSGHYYTIKAPDFGKCWVSFRTPGAAAGHQGFFFYFVAVHASRKCDWGHYFDLIRCTAYFFWRVDYCHTGVYKKDYSLRNNVTVIILQRTYAANLAAPTIEKFFMFCSW